MHAIQALSEKHIGEVNAVIRAAVRCWPLPERVCRLSLPLLQYDAVDTEHYRFLGCYQQLDDQPTLVGVVAWDDLCVHGLYVLPAAQAQGVGRALLQKVSQTLPAGCAPLRVRAQRVSATFFEQLGLDISDDISSYPYTYLLPPDFIAPSTTSAQHCTAA